MNPRQLRQPTSEPLSDRISELRPSARGTSEEQPPVAPLRDLDHRAKLASPTADRLQQHAQQHPNWVQNHGRVWLAMGTGCRWHRLDPEHPTLPDYEQLATHEIGPAPPLGLPTMRRTSQTIATPNPTNNGQIGGRPS